MNSIKIICPLEHALINRFKAKEIAVRVDDPVLIPDASRIVEETGNCLMCVILDSEKAAGEIQFNEEWINIPIALMAPSMGRFRDAVKSAQIIRRLNLRLFLPYTGENMKDTRILASIGIPSCIILDNGEIDWEDLADLMTYAILERVPHASIEPFSYIQRHYDTNSYVEWGTPYFEDPAQFIHLDSGGRAAVSHKDLQDGKFIGHIDDLETAVNTALEEKTQGRRKLFMENHACSRCPSFRICLGRVMRYSAIPRGCSWFFSEMAEVLELRHAQKSTVRERPIWQL
jgi:hypothetical protein